jgi:hypothetical protein
MTDQRADDRLSLEINVAIAEADRLLHSLIRSNGAAFVVRQEMRLAAASASDGDDMYLNLVEDHVGEAEREAARVGVEARDALVQGYLNLIRAYRQSRFYEGHKSEYGVRIRQHQRRIRELA